MLRLGCLDLHAEAWMLAQATEVQLVATGADASAGADLAPDEDSYEQLYNDACRLLALGSPFNFV